MLISSNPSLSIFKNVLRDKLRFNYIIQGSFYIVGRSGYNYKRLNLWEYWPVKTKLDNLMNEIGWDQWNVKGGKRYCSSWTKCSQYDVFQWKKMLSTNVKNTYPFDVIFRVG